MDTVLWKSVADFNLGDAISIYGFSTRLEYENCWTENFAREAILEYKKFMYLAAVSSEMVSPSEIVDVVWHQHLIFTQSYDQFCALLGRKIAHIPSTHNKSDFEKFRSASQRTQKLYAENFGEQPAQFWQYPDIYSSLGIKRSILTINKILAIGLLVSIPVLFFAYHLLWPLYITIDNPYFVRGYIIILISCSISLGYYNRWKLNAMIGTWNPSAIAFNLTGLELVYLQRKGIEHVIHGVINRLVLVDAVMVQENNTLVVTDASDYRNPAELCVIETIKAYPSLKYTTLVYQLKKEPVFAKTARALNAFQAFVNSSERFISLFAANLIIFSAVFVLGATRLVIGIARDKPVIIIGVVVLFYLIIIGWKLYLLKTTLGRKLLPDFYRENIVSESPAYAEWEWKYFLLGNAVFASTFLPLTNSSEQFFNSNNWNNSDGSDDSGSSCGSGGGDGGGSSCGSGGSSCGGCGGH